MSTIRMTGLISGLDTESIISALVSAQKLKNKKVSDKLTLSEWKEEKWKELNTKLYKLYTEDLNKMKLQSSYLTKKVTSSNDALVEVTGKSTAPDGAHTLTINQLASSQYVTGGKLDKDKNGNEITTSTSLKDLGIDVNTTIKFASGDKEDTLVVTETTTLKDFINACKNVGLNASYDTTQKRLFISSKESGSANSFTISTGTISSGGAQALETINSLVGSGSLSDSDKSTISAALATLEGTTGDDLNALYSIAVSGGSDTDPQKQEKIDAINTLISYTKTQSQKEAVTKVKDNIKQDLIDGIEGDTETDKKNQVVKNSILEQMAAELDLPIDNETVISEAENIYSTLTQTDKDTMFNQLVEKEYSSTDPYELDNTITKAEKYQNDVENETNTYNEARINEGGELVTALSVYAVSITGNTGETSELSALGLGEISGTAVTAGTEKEMTVVKASDSEITLDGAVLTGTTNTISVNGLTISLKGISEGETISLNVANNTENTYNMVKNFINSYNEILKEMNTLYYADSASDYAPLSDEEKEEMSDDEIDKWETKIKDSILRRDNTLGSVIQSMKSVMMSTVTVDGKKYSLSTYGIATSTDYTEKGLLHIYGNEDDSTYSLAEDKLMAALSEDPDTVMEVLSGISQNLYDTMYDKMSSIPNVRSIYTFYNDKLMDNEQAEYKKQIANLEEKLTEMENRYYKQFSAMETALAKLQSQSNALAGLLGTSSQ